LPHQTWAENWGVVPLYERGVGSPSNTMWPGPRPTCMPSFILIHRTFCHNTPTSQAGQTGRTERIGIGRTVLQTVAQKGKGFPYSIPSLGPGADPGVHAVSLQVTVSHPPDGRLSLFSARPAVTSPAAEHHSPLTGTNLYCLVAEAHRCEQLAQGRYAVLPRVGFEPAIY